ncbi:YbaL family putative K(+) efflux transporter [Pararhizobium sp.]|uniref:YbaL family putative K(+) efflux transporter n=1 Tax=Pararhizobium sp. TaxID=1977563 RepID=UPI00271883C7|nr:YbaL family putative K(+) efflux transporter [Pararhizobium sp.]MDO9418576.1 YbaL family putative K(+) efflux transporter [Pararhizobium sp.]
MPHETPLIATIVSGLGLAFIFGLLAQKFRLPTIAGYLMAGVFIGPFTPGFVADQGLANELAEIGVILLMFGVGLHFSLKDLLSVRATAVPGAVGQIATATIFGILLALAMGWSVGAGIVFGLALSVASTVVLLRALQERRLVETEKGRIAVGWLIVEDLVMVLALVVLPPLAGVLGGKTPETSGSVLADLIGGDTLWTTIAVTGIKVATFVALMLIVGRRVIPWVLHYVAHTGSRELFRLAVLAIALGVAYGSAKLFGVSFALGAFFAGMILAESALSQQAARETLPLRDAFAVLFFVSVGMLFNPSVLIENPLPILATFFIIIFIKGAVAYLIVRAFGHSRSVGITIAASLAQIGEFSFILVVLGVGLEILPVMAQDLVVSGALLSILVNPLLFILMDRYVTKQDAKTAAADQAQADADAEAIETARVAEEEALVPSKLSGHAVLVGYGRVGSRVGESLIAAGIPLLVIDERSEASDVLRGRGVEIISGTAGQRGLLAAANLPAARWFICAIPDAFEAGTLIEDARKANPSITILSRAHSDAEVEHLQHLGADVIMMGENEIARGMSEYILDRKEPAPIDMPPVAETPESLPGASSVETPAEEGPNKSSSDSAQL